MRIITDKTAVGEKVHSILLIIVGTLILAFGTAVFIVPFELVAGGVAGLAIIIHRLMGGFLSVDALIAILTWLLFFAGVFILGKDFALKTLLSTMVYPVGVTAFSKLSKPDVLNGFFSLSGSQYSEIAILLAALFGGLFVGMGCGFTFVGGGSTGGVDIIALSLCRLVPRWRSSAVLFAIDGLTVILGMFAIGDFVLAQLGVLSAFVSVTVIDKIYRQP